MERGKRMEDGGSKMEAQFHPPSTMGASRFITALGGQIRNSKSEIRRKSEIRNPKRCHRLRVWANESGRSATPAATLPAAPSGQPSGLRLGHNSDFGFPSDFGFRVSDIAPPRQLQGIEVRPSSILPPPMQGASCGLKVLRPTCPLNLHPAITCSGAVARKLATLGAMGCLSLTRP
jgi:hypothetical protein